MNLKALLDPRVIGPLIGTLLALGGGTGVARLSSESVQERAYRDGFQLCRDLAFENREKGLQKIIPRIPEEIRK